MLSLMLGMGFSSCGDDEYVSRIHELLLDREITFESDEEAAADIGKELTYTKRFRNEDLSNYQASSDADWCMVAIDPLESTITVKVNENNTFDERRSIVTLLDVKDGKSSRSFTVIQHQNDVIRVTDKSNTYEVITEGGQVVINLESNVSYSVQIGNSADWITVANSSGTRGLVASKVILHVAANNTEKARSAQVFIVDEDSGARTMVLISQMFKSYMRVLKTSYTIDEKGGEISIYVETNVSFDCLTDQSDSWVKAKRNREPINDNTVCQKITVDPFNEKEPKRTSTVSIENMSFGEQVVIDITQTRDLYIQESSVRILRGGTQQLTLHNANNEAVLWKSQDETVAMVDGNGNVKGLSAGSTNITVASSDGRHTDEVTVTVEKPVSQNDYIEHRWRKSYTQYDDIMILTNLDCVITNNSEFDLTIKKATFYCDDILVSDEEYNDNSGKFAIGASKTFMQEIPVEFSEDTVVKDTTYTDNLEMIVDEIVIPGKPIENVHHYKVVWEYSYSGETFTYQCEYPESSKDDEQQQPAESRKKFARKMSVRN